MNIDTFFKNLNGKTVSFCGIARSNLPVIELFASKGAKIIARDKNENLGEALEILEKVNAKLILGDKYLENLNEDMVLRSPGVPFTLPEFQEAIERGISVTSEMEIFFELCPCKIFAVTGSDGKTTTTSMIAEIFKNDEKRVHLGGNIGRPLLPIIEDISKFDIAVVELSSFQLISMKKSPDVAVITNLSPNHLDVHKDMQEYIIAKKNIFLHQSKKNRIVLNMDNDITYDCKEEVSGDLWAFSRFLTPENGAYIKNDNIYVNGTKVLDVDKLKLEGNHNVENFLAACCAVWGYVNIDSIVAVARTFGGVAHRTELVREFNGVKYYNDSIASSPTRVIKGTLSMYNQKIILIAGGADKNVSFDELGSVICNRVKILILIKPKKQMAGFKPSAADKISQSVTKHRNFYYGHPLVIRVTNMEDAVEAAREIAVNGDIVSLSPACTSFDMYNNFEIRGNHFKELVLKLHDF